MYKCETMSEQQGTVRGICGEHQTDSKAPPDAGRLHEAEIVDQWKEDLREAVVRILWYQRRGPKKVQVCGQTMTTISGHPDDPASDSYANVDNAEHGSDVHRLMWWESEQWRLTWQPGDTNPG